MLQIYAWLIVFIFCLAFFPLESQYGATFIFLWVAVRILNYYLMFRAYLMYLRLRSDFAKLGMPFPAFKFIPIWERDGSN
jgi:hypothetical protein